MLPKARQPFSLLHRAILMLSQLVLRENLYLYLTEILVRIMVDANLPGALRKTSEF